MKPTHRLRFLLLQSAAALALLVNQATAVTITWNGVAGAPGDWSAANWVSGTPVAGDLLQFGGVTTTTTNNDLTADTSFLGIDLTNNGTVGTQDQSFTLAGARITLGGNIVTTAVTGTALNDTISLAMILDDNRTITTNASHNLTISGVISETGGARTLTKAIGGGTLTLSGNNTYSGTTTISAGTLQLGDGGTAGSLNTSSAISVALGATFAVNQSDTVTQGTDFSSAAISGAGGFTQLGAGTTILNVANTYSGATVILAGKISFTDSNAFGTSSSISVRNTSFLEFGANGLDLARPVQIQNSGGVKTMQLDLAGTNTGTLSGQMDIRRVGLGEFVINTGADDTLTLSGTVYTGASGGAGITKTGAGTLSLTNAGNSYLGATNVTAGTLSLTGSLLGGGAISTSGTGILSQSAAGVISGASTLTQGSAGTSILSGANTYSGATSIAAGTLVADRADVAATSGALGNGGDIKFTGGTLQYTANSAGSDYSARIKSSTSAMTFDTNGQTVTFGTALANTNSGGLTKSGAGTLSIKHSSNYTGATTINAGKLQIDNTVSPQDWAGGLIYINNGSTLEFTGTQQTIMSGATDNITFDSGGGGSILMTKNTIWRNASFITTGGAKNTVSGQHFNGQGAGGAYRVIYDVAVGTDPGGIDLQVSSSHINVGGITKNGNGTLALTSTTNSMGAGATIIINAGTVEIGGAGTLQSGSYAGAITNNGTFKYNSSAAQTLSDVISGTGALTQSGVGTLTLTGANTYTGDTTVSAGTLAVDGDSIANSGKLVIAGGKVDATGSETVGTLFFGATQQAAGTWGSSSSTAVPPFVDDTRFSGTGVVIVPPSSGYAAWQAANSTVQAANLDHDNDGVSNGVEHFLGGTGNTTGFTTPLPGVTNTAGTLSVTWVRHPDFPDFPGNYGTAVIVETSATLADPWVPAVLGAGAGFVEITGNNVKYTFPAGSKNFARLKVTQIP